YYNLCHLGHLQITCRVWRLVMLPDYWLERPGPPSAQGFEPAFDALLNSALSAGGCPTIEVALPAAKWQFLCYVAEHHNIALEDRHGLSAAAPDIRRSIPRTVWLCRSPHRPACQHLAGPAPGENHRGP